MSLTNNLWVGKIDLLNMGGFIIMSSSGVTRPVDRMGRVVIPKEIRDQLNIRNNIDKFEISVDGDKIILKKHRKTCFFCNAVAGGVKFKDYLVCHECIETLKAIKDENGIDE